MRSMQAKVTKGEQVRLWEGSTKNLTAYETYYEAFDEYFTEGERAVSLNPNGVDACAHFRCILTFSRMPDKAPFWLDKAFRLNPMPPVYYYSYLGMTNNVLEQYEEALDAYIKGFKLNPNYLYKRIGLAETYSLLGYDEQAQIASEEVLKLHPLFIIIITVSNIAYS